jgi:hypothetical protein
LKYQWTVKNVKGMKKVECKKLADLMSHLSC